VANHKISDYWNMGTSIGLCAAIGVVLGALLGDPAMWLGIGAALGAALGAVSVSYRAKGTGKQ